MKKECVDKKIGVQLHGYELQLLSPEDTEQFEIHLMSCDYCISQLNDFAQVTQILQSDEAIEETEKSISASSIKPSFKTKVSSPLFYKSIVAATVALLLIYFGMEQINQTYQENAQQIRLFPQRSSSNNVQYLSTDQPLEIVFGFEGSIVNSCYLIEIFDDKNSMIFEDKSFSEFNASNLGKIKFASDFLERGHYKMIITDLSSSLSSNFQEYRFTISYK